MLGQIILNEQEQEGNYNFSVQPYMTKGFQATFGDEAIAIAFTSVAKIQETYPNADYLQTFKYVKNNKEIKYWCINDVDHITFLLPEEY